MPEMACTLPVGSTLLALLTRAEVTAAAELGVEAGFSRGSTAVSSTGGHNASKAASASSVISGGVGRDQFRINHRMSVTGLEMVVMLLSSWTLTLRSWPLKTET